MLKQVIFPLHSVLSLNLICSKAKVFCKLVLPSREYVLAFELLPQNWISWTITGKEMVFVKIQHFPSFD